MRQIFFIIDGVLNAIFFLLVEPEKTTSLSQVTDKLYSLLSQWAHLAMNGVQTYNFSWDIQLPDITITTAPKSYE